MSESVRVVCGLPCCMQTEEVQTRRSIELRVAACALGLLALFVGLMIYYQVPGFARFGNIATMSALAAGSAFLASALLLQCVYKKEAPRPVVVPPPLVSSPVKAQGGKLSFSFEFPHGSLGIVTETWNHTQALQPILEENVHLIDALNNATNPEEAFQALVQVIPTMIRGCMCFVRTTDKRYSIAPFGGAQIKVENKPLGDWSIITVSPSERENSKDLMQGSFTGQCQITLAPFRGRGINLTSHPEVI